MIQSEFEAMIDMQVKLGKQQSTLVEQAEQIERLKDALDAIEKIDDEALAATPQKGQDDA